MQGIGRPIWLRSPHDPREVADLAPIERLHIPTTPQAYKGTFWSYTPSQ